MSNHKEVFEYLEIFHFGKYKFEDIYQAFKQRMRAESGEMPTPQNNYPETRMTREELFSSYKPVPGDMCASGSRSLANAVLRHAIDAGQVVTREEFDNLNRIAERAERSLERAGFTDHGGQEWEPPLGKPPAFMVEVTKYEQFAVQYADDRRKRDMAIAEAVREWYVSQFPGIRGALIQPKLADIIAKVRT